MKYLIVLGFLLAMPATVHAASSWDACIKKAATQLELNACASTEAAQADALLGKTYQQLLSEVAGKPAYVAKIKAMENLWLHYRSAYLEAKFPEADKSRAYGSVYPMEADIARAQLTQAHAIELSRLINSFRTH